MAKTYLQAKQYIARSLGAEGNTTQLAAAGDALFAAIQEWNLKRDWQYLLMDTADGFSVASSTIAVDGITVTTSVSDGFSGVNVNQAVTGAGVPAGTKVLSITSTTVIVLTAASTPATVTLTFAGDITTVAGTATYNLPSPFKRPYTARVTSGNERPLGWKDQREIDHEFFTQSPQSLPEFYNLFNATSFTQSRQQGKLRVFPVPSLVETIRLRYYRPIAEPSGDSVNIDAPDRYVYALLELGRWHYLKNHDAETARLQMTEQKANELYSRCAVDDEGGTEDRDVGFIAQIDHGVKHYVTEGWEGPNGW